MSDYRRNVIDLGDKASAMLYEACVHTWSFREGKYGQPEAGVDHFRGDRSWSAAPLAELDIKNLQFTQDADGIGTKVKVSQGSSSYEGAAFDLTAMAADDAAARGYEPALMTTVLDVNKFTEQNTKYMQQLGAGIIEACRRARITLFGGETAILGSLVQGVGDNPDDNLWFSWSGTVHGLRHKERAITGSEVKAGMSLVAFRENGFRSNGLTAVQDILKSENNWYHSNFHSDDYDTTLGKAVLYPSTIYTPILVEATGGYDLSVMPQAQIAGVAHITGGGIWGKLGDLLEVSGKGADIPEPFEPPKVMQLMQRLGGIPDYDAYGTWNMGHGMIVATGTPASVIDIAAKHNVEAKEIGFVTNQPGINLRSAGVEVPGRLLVSEAK